jgi:hypothetical protein
MLSLTVVCLLAQSASSAAGTSASTPAPGAQAEWELQRDLPRLPAQVKQLLPLLKQLNPKEWIAKGASEIYLQQWESVQKEVGYLEHSAQTLARQPDRLTLALETFFRLQAIETRMGNLVEAVRKYQNPALADLLQSLTAEHLSVKVGLQQFVAEVAAQREAEWKVMESEAQRCRTQLTAPTPPAGARKTP